MATRAEIKHDMLVMIELLKRQSRQDLLRFTFATMPTFKPADFHRRYYYLLTRFATGDVKKMMVFVPPQHGKSEGSTRRLPSFILGRDPDKKLAIVSYSASKARKFSREVQRIIDSNEYRSIFPGTTLWGKNAVSTDGKYARTADEFEVVNHVGGCKAVGVGGPLTGDPVDVLIMDDLYKDAATAWSPIFRERVNDWYDTVAETRLHNGSQQLIVFTRWHEDDLAGRLIREQGEYDAETNPDGWVICTYPAIKEGAPTEYDPRDEGEALWPERHSKHKLEQVRERNPYVFGSLYQQDPKPMEGLLYSTGFRTYPRVPLGKWKIKAYTDTADTGADYLCTIVYVEADTANYVLDVLYTQKPMEFTEVRVAELMTKYNVCECIVESNNGGRGFARNVERNIRLMGNTKTHVHWFTQSQNKESRIFTHSADVQNMVFFPEGWEKLFPEFFKCLLGYLKTGKNAHDDAPDALTGTIEFRKKGGVNAADYI